MVFIKTRSGRFLSVNHIVGFAIEEQDTEMDGHRMKVFNILAYLPEPLYPSILSICYDEETAEKELAAFVDKLTKMKDGVIGLDTEI